MLRSFCASFTVLNTVSGSGGDAKDLDGGNGSFALGSVEGEEEEVGSALRRELLPNDLKDWAEKLGYTSR